MKAEQGSETGCLLWQRRRLEVSAIVFCDSAKTDAPSSPRPDFIQQKTHFLVGAAGHCRLMFRDAVRRIGDAPRGLRRYARKQWMNTFRAVYAALTRSSPCLTYSAAAAAADPRPISVGICFSIVSVVRMERRRGLSVSAMYLRGPRVRSRWSGVNSQASFSAISRCSKSFTKCQRIGDAHIWFAAPDAERWRSAHRRCVARPPKTRQTAMDKNGVKANYNELNRSTPRLTSSAAAAAAVMRLPSAGIFSPSNFAGIARLLQGKRRLPPRANCDGGERTR